MIAFGVLFVRNFIRNEIGDEVILSVSSERKVFYTLRYLAISEMQQCSTDGFGLP